MNSSPPLSAILIGATGLVGSALLDILLADERIGQVVALGRRPSGKSHPKLQSHVIDFDQPAQWAHLLRGDVLFSALGTTRSQAGSKDAQYKVDYNYQWEAAKAAAQNGVPRYVLVSSTGANAASSFFYMRMKGELDRDVQGLGYRSLHILRPGPLSGQRSKARPTEQFFMPILNFLSKIGLPRSYKPISGQQVATCMLACALRADAGAHIHEAASLHGMRLPRSA